MNENGDLFGLRDRIGDCNMALESSFYQLSNAVLQSPIRPRRPKISFVFLSAGKNTIDLFTIVSFSVIVSAIAIWR